MKKFFVLFSFLLLFFNFNYKANASDSITFPKLPLTSENNNYIIYRYDGVKDYLVTYSNVSKVYVTSKEIVFNGNGSRIYQYELISGEWVLVYNYSGASFAYSDVYYNSNDLLDSTGKVIFSKKFVPVPPVPLTELIVEVELEEVLSPILSLVGLVVSCLVSWMALRKSWTWLLSQLRSL